MPESLQSFFHKIGQFAAERALPGILLPVVGVLSIRLLLRITRNMLKRTRLEAPAVRLIMSLLRTVLYLLLFLMVASSWGIDVTGIVALASVLTLAVSLALQNALSNTIGGFTLLYTKPFAVGDFVEVSGQTGAVQDIGLHYTRLATADNKIVSIPNSAVVAAEIINYTAGGTRRVEIMVPASYDAPAEQVLQALLEAADIPAVLNDPAPFAGLDHYGDCAVFYVLRVWCASGEYAGTQYAVNARIKAAFDAKGICMPYPHLRIQKNKNCPDSE